MTFAEFVAAQGGPDGVAKKTSGAVSRSHVANIIAGRRTLTPTVAGQMEASFPDVAAAEWYAWTKERPRPEAALEDGHTQPAEV